MSRILILYGTTDGHTRKIAEALGYELESEGCHPTVVDAKHGVPDPDVRTYDGVIVLASIHGGRYQREVRHWAGDHRDALNRVPGAFLSVCLAVRDRRPEARRAVYDIMGRFSEDTGWRPAVSKPIAGALLYTRYHWLKKWIMKRIVAKAGGDIDTTRDYEYTDWVDLRAFARSFAERVAGASVVHV
jgi:menaquinone-dependent protoporphyrinogen oxidase